VAQAGLTALQLPAIEETHFIARGTFVMSLMLSYLSVFFSGLQQSSFGRAAEPTDLRLWLSSGVRWDEKKKKAELESSMVAHMILQAPFEIVVMSITLFVIGFGVYLGSAWAAGVKMDTGSQGNRAVLIAFIIPTVFVLLMYGHMMGLKDRELVKSKQREDAEIISVDVKLDHNLAETLRTQVGVGLNGLESLGNRASMKEGLDELASALREAAEARRKSANADEEVARLYETLLKML
jgi:ABC-type multidrug transport system fused ATPase/permease subunit